MTKPSKSAANRGQPFLNLSLWACLLSLGPPVLGAWGVAPWLGFSSRLGGVGSIAMVGVLSAVVVLAGLLVQRQWRPLTLIAAVWWMVICLIVMAVLPPKFLLKQWHDPAGPIFYFETKQPLVALTIDDGLDPHTTPALLDLLAEHDAKATFFVFSDTLEAHPELVRRVLDEGHELGNHQTKEVVLAVLNDSDAQHEVATADKALRRFTAPRWLRPGGGLVTQTVLDAAKKCDCPCVLGSAFPFDSHLPAPRFIAAYVGERPVAGDIIVLHDGGQRGVVTTRALEAALPRLAERGLRCVSLTELAKAAAR